MKSKLEIINNEFNKNLLIKTNSDNQFIVVKSKVFVSSSLEDFNKDREILKDFIKSFSELFNKEYQDILKEESKKVYVILNNSSKFTPYELVENGVSIFSILINGENVYLSKIKQPSIGRLIKIMDFLRNVLN